MTSIETMAETKVTERRKYNRNERGEFICTVCGENKGYNQSTMTYHMKKHEGSKSYGCTVDGCTKTFLQKSGLTQHMALVHSAVSKSILTCPLCEYATSSKANLIIHVGRNHCESWIPVMKGADSCICSSCDKICLSSTAYYYHAVQCFTAPKEMEEHLIRIIGRKPTPPPTPISTD